jgi:hypothetical protein
MHGTFMMESDIRNLLCACVDRGPDIKLINRSCAYELATCDVNSISRCHVWHSDGSAAGWRNHGYPTVCSWPDVHLAYHRLQTSKLR